MLSCLRRRRKLDLRPTSESHDEFMQRPDAETLLAEAERDLSEVERRYHEAVAKGIENPMAYAWDQP